MTISSIKSSLQSARQNGFAVPLFDVFEILGVEGVMDALLEKRAPTIMGIYSPAAAQPNCRAFAGYIRCRAEETDVPISIMLDHGSSVEQCLEVLDYGFTDVMYDGSQLPIENNMANTRRIVEAAHALGAGVEAELGHVGWGSDYHDFGGRGLGFTDPDAVEIFVKETGVDFLAIAFGNAHGLYKGEPQLNLGLVADICSRVDIPLVMHGGTGISDAQFRAAISAGISKVNYFTNIQISAVAVVREICARPEATMLEIHQGTRDAYRQWAGHLFEVFGTIGRAGGLQA
jgi:fructose-bisphosphate aldolase class II